MGPNLFSSSEVLLAVPFEELGTSSERHLFLQCTHRFCSKIRVQMKSFPSVHRGVPILLGAHGGNSAHSPSKPGIDVSTSGHLPSAFFQQFQQC